MSGYTFNITDKINPGREPGSINSRFFKIGGDEDCIELFVYYDNGIPTSAHLPMVEYSSECAVGAKLDRGGGTRIMLRALLAHVHELFPEIKEVGFDDMSRIECATESETLSARNLRPRSLVRPIDLCMFSIAFNGLTWYEKHFGARMKNASEYAAYRAAVDALLSSMPTKDELRAPAEMNAEIDRYYDGSHTFSEFVRKIPTKDRCRHARAWLVQFMSMKLGKVFRYNGWAIALPVRIVGGGKKTRYYCPKGFRRNLATVRECIM